MNFKQNKSMERLGEVFGYLFSYLLFTTILFFILVLLKKIPQTWSYFHVMGITIIISIVGTAIKRFLR